MSLSKNSSNENVEKNNRNAEKGRKHRLSLDLNQRAEEMRPPIGHTLEATSAPTLKLSKASEPLQNEHVIHYQGLEFRCNFYQKKFTTSKH